jgi:hypothetical protein
MKKYVKAVIVGVFSALATIGVVQWKSIVVALQFGSGKIEIVTHHHYPPPTEVPSSKPTPPVNGDEAPSSTQIEQEPKLIGKQLTRHRPTMEEEEDSDGYYIEEDDTESEEGEVCEDPECEDPECEGSGGV